MGEHTPTPWRVDPKKLLRVVAGDDDSVASVGLQSSLSDQWEANAALIVKAVNSHEPLTAVRRTFLGYLQAENGCKRSGASCREKCACELELQGLVDAWGGASVGSETGRGK